MLDRAAAPPFVKSTSFSLPPISRTKLPNGVSQLHIDSIQQDIIKIEVVFEAGKWFETKPEVSHFTLHMLEKGTTTLTSGQLADIFDRYGAHIEINSSFDFASVALYTLSRYFSKVYPIFLDMVFNPSFPQNELDQMKDQFLQGLKVKNEKTSYLASKAIRRQIFGGGHPYGHSSEENEIVNIERGNLVSFLGDQVRPTHLFILGKLSAAEVEMISTDFGKMPLPVRKNAPAESVQITPASSHIDKSGSVQTSIRIGKKAIQREHPDYGGLLLLNYYFGGFFGSRLMKNIREEKGLTYGISSSVHPFRYDCALLIGTDVNKDNRQMAIDEIYSEIKKLRLIDASDLELARRHFIGSLQGEIASPFSILSKVKSIELYNLEASYYSNLINEVDTISPNELQSLAAMYFHEDSFHTVSVG